MSYLEPILVHPVRRQIFGDTFGQTFYMTRDPVLANLTTVRIFLSKNPERQYNALMVSSDQNCYIDWKNKTDQNVDALNPGVYLEVV